MKEKSSKEKMRQKGKKMKNETTKIMNNVMAALNCDGIDYSIGIHNGSPIMWSKEQLFKRESSLINYDEEDFQSKFEEFAMMPHHYKIEAAYWADDDKCVIIQLQRLYKMEEEEWKKYAEICGYDTPDEAVFYCGNPSSSYIRMNVRIDKYHTKDFVQKYAHYFWK